MVFLLVLLKIGGNVMSCDRFVHWKDNRPTKDELQFALEDYIGKAGKVKWSEDGGRWTCRLAGNSSFPLQRVLPVDNIFVKAFWAEHPWERWFEVFWGDDYISVITRRADEYTSAVADGFTKLVMRFWQTKGFKIAIFRLKKGVVHQKTSGKRKQKRQAK